MNRNGARCPYHSEEQRARGRALDQWPASLDGEPRVGAIASRDPHAVAWLLLGYLLDADELDAARRASAGATLLRVIQSLGEPPVSRERMAAEAALMGMVMHGLPPRDPEEWALAGEVFTPEGIAMMRGWDPIGEPGFSEAP